MGAEMLVDWLGYDDDDENVLSKFYENLLKNWHEDDYKEVINDEEKEMYGTTLKKFYVIIGSGLKNLLLTADTPTGAIIRSIHTKFCNTLKKLSDGMTKDQ